MVDKLTNLVAIFENPALDFRNNRANDDDLLGDAYEYLMHHFARESGKSKGQFYTPTEVSQVISKIIDIHTVSNREATIYDPTCGSGSLLLRAVSEVPKEVGSISIYGQEKDVATRGLAKMNMIMHGNPSARIALGNTLSSPEFTTKGNLQRFDFAVANPPFSDKKWVNGSSPENDPYGRYQLGIPPNKNGDYAYFLHLLKSLNSEKGKGAIILPHGVLFRGNSEAVIRKKIVEHGYIKGIIGLPANLFFGTGIPACIIVIDKEKAAGRKGIFMIDASKGYIKDGNKNRLRHQDIHKIVETFNQQIEVPRYARMIAYDEIEANEFNLNIPRYIDTSEPEDIQDIEAHLLGGIPVRDIDALEDYWRILPSLKHELFEVNGREGYRSLAVDKSKVKATIFDNPEFTKFGKLITDTYNEWQANALPCLQTIDNETVPKELIEAIAGNLLERFEATPLLNKYDVYQQLMQYWSDVMRDDVYALAAEGWEAGKQVRPLRKQGKKYTEEHDLEIDKKRYKAEFYSTQFNHPPFL